MESVGVLPLVVGGWGQWVYSVVVEDGISGCTHIGSRRVGSVGVFTVVVEDGSAGVLTVVEDGVSG